MYGELRNKDNKKIREKEYYEMLQKELEKRAGEDTEFTKRPVRSAFMTRRSRLPSTWSPITTTIWTDRQWRNLRTTY